MKPKVLLHSAWLVALPLILGAASCTPAPSDRRLKRDVIKLGPLDNDIDLYRYRYLWSDEEFVGVMAQEVREVRPDAVVEGSDGFLRVNYAALGTKLHRWESWRRLNA